jgi:hypothetical protein
VTELVLLGVVNYLYILFRALQSRAVNYAKHLHIVLIGSTLGALETFYIITLAAQERSLDVVFTITLTGTLGCLSAVHITRRY